MRAPQAPLEISTDNVSGADRKRLRYQRREMLWGVTKIQRISHCGRVPRSREVGVTLRIQPGAAGYAGLQHCGSVWACPVCAARILAHRGLEIGAVLGEAIAQGHPLAFITLTMRHRSSQNLRRLWDAGGKGWTRAITGNGWVKVEALVAGWVRVWEVTHGRNGWHVHVHIVMVLEKGATEADLDVVAGGMFDRWSRGLQAAGLSAPKRKGQDWHMVTGDQAAERLAEYLAKSVSVIDQMKAASAREATATGLGLELTHTMPGRARDDLKTRPVWALLDDLAETGEVGPWWEWEAVSKGRKQVGWSNGMRKRFAPALEELSDEVIAEQELGSASDAAIRWTYDQWRAFVVQPGKAIRLREAAEVGGKAAAVALLDEWGDPYQVIVPDEAAAGSGGAQGRSPGAPPARSGRQAGPMAGVP